VINSGSPDGFNKKCSGGDLSVYGRLRLRWMLSLQFMQNIAASLSCMAELYCMFYAHASENCTSMAQSGRCLPLFQRFDGRTLILLSGYVKLNQKSAKLVDCHF
jgi:hypothetical protein